MISNTPQENENLVDRLIGLYREANRGWFRRKKSSEELQKDLDDILREAAGKPEVDLPSIATKVQQQLDKERRGQRNRNIILISGVLLVGVFCTVLVVSAPQIIPAVNGMLAKKTATPLPTTVTPTLLSLTDTPTLPTPASPTATLTLAPTSTATPTVASPTPTLVSPTATKSPTLAPRPTVTPTQPISERTYTVKSKTDVYWDSNLGGVFVELDSEVILIASRLQSKDGVEQFKIKVRVNIGDAENASTGLIKASARLLSPSRLPEEKNYREIGKTREKVSLEPFYKEYDTDLVGYLVGWVKSGSLEDQSK